jgi:hypothetical protein
VTKQEVTVTDIDVDSGTISAMDDDVGSALVSNM